MKLLPFTPELALITGSITVFICSLRPRYSTKAKPLTLLTFTLCLLLSAASLNQETILFNGSYRIDYFSQIIKFFLFFFALLFTLSTTTKDISSDIRPEFYLVLIISTTGLTFLSSAIELLTMFISLELSSYSMYLLVPFRDDKTGLRIQMESAIKYIMFGVASSGIMLIGIGYIFGITGTTHFIDIQNFFVNSNSNLINFSFCLLLAGFLFKIAVFPFHFWSPDVYQGASNETTTFIATVPKIVAVAMIVRLIYLFPLENFILTQTLTIISIISMFFGNIIALIQNDLKRLLAYSGIAHAGYALLGMLGVDPAQLSLSIYYIVGYSLMSLGAFLVICSISHSGINLTTTDLKGLYKRSPILAFTLAVCMFSLAGLPPSIGFMGKFLLMAEAYKTGHFVLVVCAAINTAISIYYYLNIIRVTYTSDPEISAPLPTSYHFNCVVICLIFLIVAGGLFPDLIINPTQIALKTTLP